MASSSSLPNLLRPTAESPVMPNEVSRLVAMLDKGDTIEMVFMELSKTHLFDCIEDKRWLTDYLDNMINLLHSMSRPLLRCILTGNLGPDLYDKHMFGKNNWEYVLDINGPGSYAMFSFIRDRKGKWLCVREIKALISLLGDYRDAIEACDSLRQDDVYGDSQLDDVQKKVVAKAMEIDDAERTNKQELTLKDVDQFSPRFESSSKGSCYISDMIKMLERRCLPGVDEEVWQCQSPLLVGNAGNMGKRTPDHFPNNSLSKTAKLWGLMLSCFSVMGLNYEVQAVPLFRAWEDGKQVNAAEVLGTVLAGSMVSASGLNVKQPGTRYAEARMDPFSFQNSKRHVFADKPWFRENLRASILGSKINAPVVRRLEEDKKRLAELREEVAELTAKAEEAGQKRKKAWEEYDKVKAEVLKRQDRVKEFLAKYEKK
ncbi:hypothetical protein GGR51DRAFT_503808 [Nemania sp. FL0031]|nr:hypothetical protein GGR51DRAFT_503808 [Nemania sp. FL0031]